MNGFKQRLIGKARTKIADRHGMTMAELIIVVAIIIVLAAVAFISIIHYQRVLAQLERDKISKEIFIAAQNHLTASRGQNYLGETDADDYGYQSVNDDVAGDTDKGIYYYVVDKGVINPNSAASISNQVLPFGAIDETIRGGGSYIVRYQPKSGRIMDVFYCSGDSSRFGYSLTKGNYKALMSTETGDGKGFYGVDNKTNRRDHFNGGDSIVGWYGGADAQNLPSIELKSPKLEVFNAERLYVKVTDNTANYTKYSDKYSIRLIVTGKTSGAKKSFLLLSSKQTEHALQNTETPKDDDKKRLSIKDGHEYTIVLDDITTKGLHFANIDADTSEKFIPGEQIKIEAVAYSLENYANIAYSTAAETNSLFERIEDDNSVEDTSNSNDSNNGSTDNTTNSVNAPSAGSTVTAYISNMRHLENMDESISNVNNAANKSKLVIPDGVQTADMIWVDSIEATNDFVTTVSNQKGSGGAAIYKYNDEDDASTISGEFLPVDLTRRAYNGKNYSITGLIANNNVGGNSGVFGKIEGSTVQNLELIDFNISGTNAGTLAGTVTAVDGKDSTIINVLSRNSNIGGNTKTTASVTGTSNAGGLIGSASGAEIKYSAAAVCVTGSTATAGGLIGSSSANVTSCYSGGHTEGGSYIKWIYKDGKMLKTNGTQNEFVADHNYDVTGSTTGGLIGAMTGGTVEKCYSTCSVNGTVSGGFVGSNPATGGGVISNSYCTGLVNTSQQAEDVHAFLGSGSTGGTEGTGNKYYSIINEYYDNTEKKIKYMESAATKTGISAFDDDTEGYNSFVGTPTSDAEVYDDSGDGNLKTIYNGKYVLKPISKFDGVSVDSNYYVKAHYGDWPAPEVFVINTSN